jgi:hypothetical protein
MCDSTDARPHTRWWIDAVLPTFVSVGFVVVLVWAQAVADGVAAVNDNRVAAVRIYADADWYRTRPEPERRWHGFLKKRPVVAGPSNRTALTFALVTKEGTYPVYAAGVGKDLAPFTGWRLEVEGKLVDLTDEGFGKELWVASFRPLSEGAR